MIDQLVNIYLNYETWHETKLSEAEAHKYFQRLISKGRIIWTTNNKSIIGYVESWRIDYEQFGRVICKASFSAFSEDVETGNIAYLANTWVQPEYRWKIHKLLRNKFFEQNKDCEYFVGEARRKKTGLIKVFKRSEIFLKGGNHGERENDNRTNPANTTASYAYANC